MNLRPDRLLLVCLLLWCFAARTEAQELPADRCDSLLRAAHVQFVRESYSDALDTFRQAQEASQGPGDARYRQALQGIGSVYAALGDEQQARSYMDRARELDTPEGRETYYRDLGQITEQAAQQARISAFRNETGKLNTGEAENPDQINLSLPESARDLYRQAVDYYLQAFAIREPQHDDTCAGYLMSIAYCQAVLGERQTAGALADRSLGITAQLHGRQSTQYAAALGNASRVCMQADDYRQARDLLRRSIRLYRKQGVALQRDTLRSIGLLDALAAIRYDSGQKASGLRTSKRSNRLRRLYYGELSEPYAQGLLNLSTYYTAMPAVGQAQRFHYAAFDYYFGKVRNNFSVMSESDREKYWNKALGYFQQSIALAHTSHTWYDNIRAKRRGSPATAYNTMLLSKGILLNSSIEFGNRIRQSGDARLMEDYRQLGEMRQMLDSLAPASREGNELNQKTDKLEEQILTRLRNAGHDYTQNLSVKWDSVRNALDRYDVAIEFYRTAKNEYGALVLKRHWRGPRLVRLRKKKVGGDIARMTPVARKQAPAVAQQTGRSEKWVRGYTVFELLNDQRSSQDTLPEYYYKSLLMDSWPLSRAVWGRLRRYMPAKQRGNVYFSPDGILHLLGIEYLPARKPWVIRKHRLEYRPEATMSDRYKIYRLSSTKQLVTADKAAPMLHAGLYGGINYAAQQNSLQRAVDSLRKGASYLIDRDYERRLGSMPEKQYALLRGTQSESDKSRIDPLPGTAFEVHRIDTLLTDTPTRTNLFTGAFASEEVFRISGESENLIHLATHAFFIPSKAARRYGFIQRAAGRNAERMNNPLYRTGLFLSGSKATWTTNSLPYDGLHDGILTAKEISLLDLRQANLIVLSACKTAAGDLQQDGVFGLQRAFKKAGARTLIMSLWKVDDKATELMMTHFYRNYLLRGLDKRDAFIQAQKALREDERYKSPFYWSAFLLLDPDIPSARHASNR